jgi:hypothetical protein
MSTEGKPVAGFLPQRPEFAARSPPVAFVVDKAALKQGLRVLRFSLLLQFHLCPILTAVGDGHWAH